MKNIAVLGAGNIGSLISILLATNEYNVHLLSDNFPDIDFETHGIHLCISDVSDTDSLQRFVKDNAIDVIVSALPYYLNIGVATIANENNINYFDLTEDVGVKNHILNLVETSSQNNILMPQCGLAPGFINIVGADLMRQFDSIHEAKLRVGALPQTISNSLKYNLTWSTNGLVNEYGNPCEAIVEGRFVDDLMPLEGVETTLIDGVEYEAFNTSGGLGTLAETFAQKARNLNYKTLRYPGHCEKIKFLMFDLRLNEKRHVLENILEQAVPMTKQDVIVIYSAVSGNVAGKFKELSYVNKVYPREIAGQVWAGIQVTTAAGVCAALDITINNPEKYNGFVRQEDINLDEFINNRFGEYYLEP